MRNGMKGSVNNIRLSLKLGGNLYGQSRFGGTGLVFFGSDTNMEKNRGINLVHGLKPRFTYIVNLVLQQ